MGRPLFSASFMNPIGSEEDSRLAAVAEEAGPRQWCEKDADPDEDTWWAGKDIVIESFVDRPIESASGHVETEVSTTAHSAANAMDTKQNNIDSGKLMQQSPTQIQHHQHNNIDLAAPFPGRFTISERELARVTLDSVVMNDDIEEEEDDFELLWDAERDEYDVEDMDVYDVDGPPSDTSTPAPPTPVMDPVTESSNLIVLPTAASSIHDFSNSCLLPASTTPATPLHRGGLPLPAPSMSSPSAARSVARVRGFVVHSPRTELVL